MSGLPRELESVVAAAAGEARLPLALVRAIVVVESAGNRWAWRAEPAYRWLWDWAANRPFRRITLDERVGERAPDDFPHPPWCSRHTEWWGQQCSWGPMQVMGAVARQHGYVGPFPRLCGPEGVRVGCRHLAILRDEHGPDWRDVAAAYNAGRPRRRQDGRYVNQDYVDRVAAAGGFDGD